MNRTQKFLTDGILLAFAAVFMRTVGVLWNAFVSNTVGTESMGLLSLVMSVYGFSVTFACSGVGLGVTRTVSEALGRNDNRGAVRALTTALTYACVFGIASSAVLFFGAEKIACYLLCDMRTLKSIRLLSVSMLPIALSSVFNGYFNAVRRVYKSAAASIFEQFARMFVCVILFGILLPKGTEGACLAIVAGGVCAECLSALASALAALIDSKQHIKFKKDKNTTSYAASLKELCVISVPIAASTYIRSALLTVEHMLIPRALKQNGLSHTSALESYGMLGSMVLPIVLYPAALTGAFASLLVPELARANAAGDKEHIRRAANKAIIVTFAFSACVAGVMISYSGALGRVIYGSAEAGHYIRLLAPIIPIMYLDTVIDSILKGLGYQVYTMAVNIADAAFSVVGVILLIPRYGILGYVILICISEMINASASFYKLTKIVEVNCDIIRIIFIPTLFSILSCFAVRILYSKCIYLSAESAIGLCVHITTVIVIYAIMCVAVNRMMKPTEKQKILKKASLNVKAGNAVCAERNF